jgi:signal-transduction protein with cAMP-binding, CBS, and nucleotidyltransferase domain
MPSRQFEPVVRTRVLVREIMNSPVLSATPEEDIRSVSEKMSRAKVGSVVIMKNDLPMGIITDGDIVSKVVSKNLTPSEVRAGDIMSTPIRTIESEKEIIEAARQMVSYKIKRLGVSYKRNLVGIISISDIIAVTPELFDIISEKRAIMTSEGIRQPSYLAGYCDHCNQWSDVLLEVDNRFLCEECRAERGNPEEITENSTDES